MVGFARFMRKMTAMRGWVLADVMNQSPIPDRWKGVSVTGPAFGKLRAGENHQANIAQSRDAATD
jgi:hypothetical protein